MDSWLNEYDRLVQISNELSANIKEFHAQTRAGSNPNNVKLSAIIRRGLVQLTTDIARLQDTLPDLNILEREKNRRKDMLFNLTTRKDQLSDELSRPDQANRDSPSAQLKSGSNAQAQGKPRAWGAAKETDMTKDLDNAQLLQLQKDQMAIQDDQLEILSQSVGRQKEVAITINSELNEHNKLLEDLEVKTAKTQNGIERERKHVKKVSESSKVCGLWIVIMLLVIALIVFAATDWGCKIHYVQDRCS